MHFNNAFSNSAIHSLHRSPSMISFTPKSDFHDVDRVASNLDRNQKLNGDSLLVGKLSTKSNENNREVGDLFSNGKNQNLAIGVLDRNKLESKAQSKAAQELVMSIALMAQLELQQDAKRNGIHLSKAETTDAINDALHYATGGRWQVLDLPVKGGCFTPRSHTHEPDGTEKTTLKAVTPSFKYSPPMSLGELHEFADQIAAWRTGEDYRGASLGSLNRMDPDLDQYSHGAHPKLERVMSYGGDLSRAVSPEQGHDPDYLREAYEENNIYV